MEISENTRFDEITNLLYELCSGLNLRHERVAKNKIQGIYSGIKISEIALLRVAIAANIRIMLYRQE